MSKDEHDRLLAAAVEAQATYEATVEKAKVARSRAFAEALRGTVSAVELAEHVGFSHVHVGRIAKGQS